MYGLSYLVPRVCWMTFLILMLVWICKTQNGFAYTNTKMGSQGYLNRKAHGSKDDHQVHVHVSISYFDGFSLLLESTPLIYGLWLQTTISS